MWDFLREQGYPDIYTILHGMLMHSEFNKKEVVMESIWPWALESIEVIRSNAKV